MPMKEETQIGFDEYDLSMEDLIPDEDVIIARNQSRIHQAHDTG